MTSCLSSRAGIIGDITSGENGGKSQDTSADSLLSVSGNILYAYSSCRTLPF
jgi:hypothetical protein